MENITDELKKRLTATLDKAYDDFCETYGEDAATLFNKAKNENLKELTKSRYI